MLDGRPWRGTGAAVVSRDNHVVTLALGHTSSNGAHTDFRHQLDTDARMRCHVLQVVDQLGQVLDRINVVVGWWGNQTHTWHAVAQLASVLADLTTRQLTAFAWLGTLRHLDLDLVRTVQVFRSHTKSTGGDLLDA